MFINKKLKYNIHVIFQLNTPYLKNQYEFRQNFI